MAVATDGLNLLQPVIQFPGPGGLSHRVVSRVPLHVPGYHSVVGLHEPLQKHMQSVLPFLERRGRSDRYLAQLNSLANALQNTGEPPQDSASFGSWCTRYLSHDRSPKPELPLKPTPKDAPLYAQGYLAERQTKRYGNSAGITTKAGCSPGT